MPPVQHVASMESVRIPLPGEKKMQPNEEPRIQRDPMTTFENFHFEIQATLNGWMTYSEEDRKRRAALFSSNVLTDAKTLMERQQYKWTPERRHKVLNYIIWLESIHPKGSEQVARVAYHGLFPKK